MGWQLPLMAAVVVAGLLAYNEFIENPHIRELQKVEDELACTVRTASAAEGARAAEAARQRKANDNAQEAWRAALAERDRLHQMAQDKLEQEIAINEEALAAAGRSCGLDQSDIDWVRN